MNMPRTFRLKVCSEAVPSAHIALPLVTAWNYTIPSSKHISNVIFSFEDSSLTHSTNSFIQQKIFQILWSLKEVIPLLSILQNFANTHMTTLS